MSDSEQEHRVEPNIGQPIDLQPNPALGWLRFFVWLTPTGIVVLCLFLSGSNLLSLPFGDTLISILGIGMFLSCAWFDSKLALVCRNGSRRTGHHILQFSLTQILVITAVLFAIVFAICATGSW